MRLHIKERSRGDAADRDIFNRRFHIWDADFPIRNCSGTRLQRFAGTAKADTALFEGICAPYPLHGRSLSEIAYTR